MKKIVILLILLQGIAMSKGIEEVDVNGTKVPMVFEQSAYVPLISMQIVFKNSGAIYDKKTGLADMASKLLAEGTKKDGSVGFASKLENSAIHLSASAGNETFSIQLSALKSEFDKALSLFQELLQDPNYTQETMEHITRQKIGWLTQKESDFDYIASLGLKEILFKGTPLGRPRAGDLQSIESMRLDEIKHFIATHLGKNNAIVVIGGDITLADAKRAVASIVGLLPEVTLQESAYINATDKKSLHKREAKTEQAYIYFGAPYDFKYSDPNQYISKVVSYILGGSGFGSRLMEEIRVKRGLAYSAYSRFVIDKTSSYLSGYLQTKLENEKEAQALVQTIIEKFVAEGITQKELDAAKEFLIGSEPLRGETLHQRLNRSYREYYYERPLGYDKEQLKKIEALKLDEINSFIKTHTEITQISYSIVTAEK